MQPLAVSSRLGEVVRGINRRLMNTTAHHSPRLKSAVQIVLPRIWHKGAEAMQLDSRNILSGNSCLTRYSDILKTIDLSMSEGCA